MSKKADIIKAFIFYYRKYKLTCKCATKGKQEAICNNCKKIQFKAY